MTVYSDDIATALELLNEFGQTCYWQKPASADGPGVPGYPVAGALPSPSECKIAFFSAKDLDRGVMQFNDMMPGTEVPDNMQIGLLAGGQAFEPKNTDWILRGTVDAEPTSISKIDVLAPNGEAILYFITVAA